MTDMDLFWCLIAMIIGLIITMGLIILHERANRRSELNEILMRNGGEDE